MNSCSQHNTIPVTSNSASGEGKKCTFSDPSQATGIKIGAQHKFPAQKCLANLKRN